jgi:hypothetical protein
MPKPTRSSVAAVVLLSGGMACTAISGLDDLREVACTSDCDPDGSPSQDPNPDSSLGSSDSSSSWSDASPRISSDSSSDTSSGGSSDGSTDVVQTPLPVVFHGESQTSSFTLSLPPNTVQGDLVLAGLALGNVSATGGPGTPQPPAGWALLDDVIISPDTACLFLFWAIQGPSLVWPATWQVGDNSGVAWAVSFGGVDTTAPFVAHVTGVSAGSGASWSSPTLAGVAAGNMIVATFGDYASIPNGGGPPPEWSLPAPWTARSSNLTDGVRRSAIVGDLLATATTSIQVVGTAAGGSAPPANVTAGLVALRPQH